MIARVRPAHDHLPTMRSRQDLSIVVDAVDRVRRQLSPASIPAIEEITDLPAAVHALRSAWACVEQVLEADPAAAGHVRSSEDLLDLTRLLRRAEQSVHQLQGDRFANQLAAVREVLGRFSGIESVRQLVQECPRAVSRLGFDRAMYSLINGSVWAPQSAYSTRRPEAAKQLVTAAQKVPQSLTSTVPEFDLLRRRTSILVTDVRDNPNVYREIAVASRCRAYVATRVVANGDVVGFIHADKVLGRNDVDNFDRNLLGLFGEAFGYILARAMIVDEANAVQSRLLSLAAGVKQAASGLRFLEQDPALARQSRQQCGPPDSTGPRGLPLATYGLTKRETQVLQLMTTGLDNAEIASRLYVAAGTVKSHVKHILRKLGASNRAEAVSLWFNSTLVTSS